MVFSSYQLRLICFSSEQVGLSLCRSFQYLELTGCSASRQCPTSWASAQVCLLCPPDTSRGRLTLRLLLLLLLHCCRCCFSSVSDVCPTDEKGSKRTPRTIWRHLFASLPGTITLWLANDNNEDISLWFSGCASNPVHVLYTQTCVRQGRPRRRNISRRKRKQTRRSKRNIKIHVNRLADHHSIIYLTGWACIELSSC